MQRTFYIGLFALFSAFLIIGNAEETQQPLQTYTAIFDQNSRVYDGDTLQDISIVIKTFSQDTDFPTETLWPGILLKGNTLYAVTDIRVNSLDTAEKRPLKKGRTQESLTLEKEVAQQAKAAVEQLLSDNNWEFVITNPQQGKYAGRTLCDVFVGNQEKINLAKYLIDKGLGYEYEGGRKKNFDEWYKKDLIK